MRLTKKESVSVRCLLRIFIEGLHQKIADFLISVIKFYRQYLSRLKPPTCRFYPTCSQYAIECIQKQGLFVGFIKTFWRVIRCHPFSRGGYDPPIKE